MRASLIRVAVLSALLGALTPADARPEALPGVQLVPAFGGLKLTNPICVTNNGTDTFICEQAGRILRAATKGDATSVSLYLDIQSKVINQGQGGLLCLAFHPKFPADGRLFVSYLAKGPSRDPVGKDRFQLRVSSFRGTATQATPTSERVLLRVDMKRPMHQAGGLAFGPDGALYVSTGDDAAKRFDEQKAVQDSRVRLGKILAFDVSTPGHRKPAPGNFWFKHGGAVADIFSYGFRNPWRFDWDDQGRLWTVEPGLKGLTSREWVIEAKNGHNARWPFYEGDRKRRKAGTAEPRSPTVKPAFVYGGAEAAGRTASRDTAGVGGKFYRGKAVPTLKGKFIFCDVVQGDVYALDLSSGKGTDWRVIGSCKGPADIGRDAAGELYVCAFEEGAVYKIVPK